MIMVHPSASAPPTSNAPRPVDFPLGLGKPAS